MNSLGNQYSSNYGTTLPPSESRLLLIEVIRLRNLKTNNPIYCLIEVSTLTGDKRIKIKPDPSSYSWIGEQHHFDVYENLQLYTVRLFEQTVGKSKNDQIGITQVSLKDKLGTVVEEWHHFRSIPNDQEIEKKDPFEQSFIEGKGEKNGDILLKTSLLSQTIPSKKKRPKTLSLIRSLSKPGLFSHHETYRYDLFQILETNNIEFISNYLKHFCTIEDINIRDKSGYTPLMSYCAQKNLDEKILLQLLNFEGINVTRTNIDGNTALHYYCQNARLPELMDQIFELFIKKGAKEIINIRNNNGETALFKAIFNKNLRILLVETLLDYGADVNIVNNQTDHEAPLHYAVRMCREDLVKELVKAGADLDLLGRDQKTAYELALETPNCDRIARYLKRITAQTKHINSLFRSIGPTFQGVPPPSPSDEVWNISAEDVEFTKKLGSGASGDVYKGLWNQHIVAIKVLKDSSTEQLKQFHHEFRLLSQLRSDNIVRIYGYFTDPAPGIIMELCRTSLSQYLKTEAKVSLELDTFLGSSSAPSASKLHQTLLSSSSSISSPHSHQDLRFDRKSLAFTNSSSSNRSSSLSNSNELRMHLNWKQFFSFIKQIISGVNALHSLSPPIVHRDLKSLNILLTSDWVCKICDFGTSRTFDPSNTETLKQMRGTLIYLAPEVAKGENFTPKGDVYSCGIIIWEILNFLLTGKYSEPYDEYSQNGFALLMEVTINQLRPTLSSNCPESLREMIKSCLLSEVNSRPSSSELLETIHKIEKEYLNAQTTWRSLLEGVILKSREDTSIPEETISGPFPPIPTDRGISPPGSSSTSPRTKLSKSLKIPKS